MNEFDWQKELLPVDGCAASVTCEELYQAIKARLVQESGVQQNRFPGLYERAYLRED